MVMSCTLVVLKLKQNSTVNIFKIWLPPAQKENQKKIKQLHVLAIPVCWEQEVALCPQQTKQDARYLLIF